MTTKHSRSCPVYAFHEVLNEMPRELESEYEWIDVKGGEDMSEKMIYCSNLECVKEECPRHYKHIEECYKPQEARDFSGSDECLNSKESR